MPLVAGDDSGGEVARSCAISLYAEDRDSFTAQACISDAQQECPIAHRTTPHPAKIYPPSSELLAEDNVVAQVSRMLAHNKAHVKRRMPRNPPELEHLPPSHVVGFEGERLDSPIFKTGVSRVLPGSGRFDSDTLPPFIFSRLGGLRPLRILSRHSQKSR